MRSFTIITHSTAWSGTHVWTRSIALALAELGCEIRLLQFRHDLFDRDEHLRQRARVISVNASLRDYRTLRSWCDLLTPFRGSVILNAKPTFGFRSLPFDLACKLSAVRYGTLEAHPASADYSVSRYRQLGPLTIPRVWYGRQLAEIRLYSHLVDVVLTSSDHTKRALDGIGFATRHAHTVYPVLDEYEEAIPSVRDQHLICTVSRLHEDKRIDLLIRGFALAKRTSPALRLIVCGSGPQESELKRLSAELGLSDRDVQFSGFVPNVAPLLQTANIFAHTSAAEGFGIALAEALRAGCLCLATDSGGTREVLDGGRAGLITDSDSPEAIALGIKTLTSLDESSASAQRTYGATLTQERFSYSALSQRLSAIQELWS